MTIYDCDSSVKGQGYEEGDKQQAGNREGRGTGMGIFLDWVYV